MLPLQAQKYVEIVRKRGEAGKPINRVYRMIQHRDMFLMAYTHLYANKGALTPGVNREDPIDGMSQRRIDTIVNKLQEKNYTWTPVRRTYIDKKNSSNKRPLGIPGWSDKLLQEVIRMVLEAYYEPQFRNCSHGFRCGRSCHTALQAINVIGKGTGWFIEGDIQGCFDEISHKILYKLLAEKIKDRDFLRLIGEMLNAGYMEEWRYHTTYSGTPQGGIVSPLLMNIVLNELDAFVEDRLILEHTAGKKRRLNTAYTKLRRKAQHEKEQGKWKQANDIRRQYTKMPSVDTKAPTYRRLWYVRDADDFLLGYIGTKQEAERVKERLGQFLREELALELSEEKTLITNAFTEKARFLNYEIRRNRADNVMKEVRGHTRRTVNAILWFAIPKDVPTRWESKVTEGGKVIHRKNLMNLSDYDIIMSFEIELQGLINYYSMAHNLRAQMGKLRYLWQESLLKTLAVTHKISKPSADKRYRTFLTRDGRRTVGGEIQRKAKKPLRATFGKKPLIRKAPMVCQDRQQTIYRNSNELLTRMLADVCELCGSPENVEGHHIRKLATLRNLYKGRREKPEWVRKMIAMRRKTLVVCRTCHEKIHKGKYDGVKLTEI